MWPRRRARTIDDAEWVAVIEGVPILGPLDDEERARLRGLVVGSTKIRGVKRRDRPPSEKRIGRSRSMFGRSTVGVGYFDPTDFGASPGFGLAPLSPVVQ